MYTTLNHFRKGGFRYATLFMSYGATNLLPKPSDIEFMFMKGSEKAKNDEENKIRENVLVNIFNTRYENHPKYGEKWKDVRSKWENVMRKISPIEDYCRVELEQKAGRSNHYDFNVTYYDYENRTYVKRVEFKHNATSISAMPQFLSLPLKSAVPLMNNVSYSEFYYDAGHLDN